jgi:AraC-like DNA-binding protein
VELDVGTGLVATLATGGIATVGTFRHADRPHRDPPEETFRLDTVIVPVGGSWVLHGGRGRHDVEPGVVVTGRRGSWYGARHDLERPGDTALFVQLRPGAIAADDGLLDLALGHDVVPRTAAIGAAAAHLWCEARDAGRWHTLGVDLLATRLILELARMRPDRSARHPAQTRAADVAVDAAREHLDTHFAEPIDLATLSRVALMSPFHLARAFRARVGTSPHRYLMDVRLRAAEAMLREGELTVTSVADHAGFASPSHLSRRFAERYGMSPSSYRRTFGQGTRTSV